ncbi:MAG: hypothetical protein IPK67_10405 [Planctomycetes bacterium]|nr:hypothetical protein [Planctomycetota bacterium]
MRTTCQTSGINARERLVFLEQIIKVEREIADRNPSGAQSVCHQRADAEPTSMVLHPSGLERSVLPVVAEHEESRPLGVLHHVLRQHVNVGDVCCAHRACGLSVASPDAPARGSAR